MSVQHLKIRYPGDSFGGLHCPFCGREVASSESPCEHIAFVLLRMMSDSFSYVSDAFAEEADRLTTDLDCCTDEDAEDEEHDSSLTLEQAILNLDGTSVSFIVSVASEEFCDDAWSSDLGYFGFAAPSAEEE